MALIQFTKNHIDHSTDKGYQFEFFCDMWLTFYRPEGYYAASKTPAEVNTFPDSAGKKLRF